MKKTTKKIIFLTLILMLSICFSTRVEAKTCSDYTVKNCPASAGNENCFANPYATDGGGACEKKVRCEEYNRKLASTVAGWYLFTNNDVRDTTKNACTYRDDCYLDNVKSGQTIYYICKTRQKNSKPCDKLSLDECKSAVGCVQKNNSCTKEKKEIPTYIINGKESFKCSDVKHLTSIWMFLRIITPFIIVLFGSLDFFKAMAAGDEKGIKTSRGKFIKRLIAFFLFILLPFAIQFIFERIGTNGSQNLCLIKCITTNNTSSKGCD